MKDNGMPTLVELNHSSAPLKVFCTHTIGGGVRYYEGLARQLSDVAAFYGLEEPYLYDDFEYESLPELAEYHVDVIKRNQGSGPYILMGYCSGGPIAYEIACQLRMAGEAVSGLAIFGSLVLGFDRSEEERFLFLKPFLSEKTGRNLDELDWVAFESMSEEQVVSILGSQLAEAGIEAMSTDKFLVRKYIHALCRMRRATKRYRPSKSDVDIGLYERQLEQEVAEQIVPWCDWSTLTRGKLSLFPPPPTAAEHNDVLLEPYLTGTADKVRRHFLNEQ